MDVTLTNESTAAAPAPKKSRKPAKAAKKTKPAKKFRVTKRDTAERTNKKADVIAMMRRKDGATLDAIVHATGWQKHTVRGFISILNSKGGHRVESAKNAAGQRTYRIAK
jgi:hypothetical protein